MQGHKSHLDECQAKFAYENLAVRLGRRVSGNLSALLDASIEIIVPAPPQLQTAAFQLGFASCVLLYLVCGALVFLWLEGGQEQTKVVDQAQIGLGVTADTNLAPTSTQTQDKWSSFPTVLMFTFTVMTTIGYGHVAPSTPAGRAFCMLYGMIGIPLAMLTVANFGKFIKIGLEKLLFHWGRLCSAIKVTILNRRAGMANGFWKKSGTQAAVELGVASELILSPTLLATSLAPHQKTSARRQQVEPSANLDKQNTNGNAELKSGALPAPYLLNESGPRVSAATMQMNVNALQMPSARTNSQSRAKSFHSTRGLTMLGRVLHMQQQQQVGNPDDPENQLQGGRAGIVILVAFLLYILLGSMVMHVYENDFDLFTAIYFNFVTLTTVGLGDVVPTSTSFLWFTIGYIMFGLALTTMAIEVASEYLQKLHFFGRVLPNPSNVRFTVCGIAFCCASIKVRSLLRSLGEMYGVHELSGQGNVAVLNDLIEKAITKEEENGCSKNSETEEFAGAVKLEHFEDFTEKHLNLDGVAYVDDDSSHLVKMASYDNVCDD